MPEKTILEVRNIDTFYGSLQVLWDITLEIRSGEIVAIIGANGSGKSSLLNTISGVIHPERGSVSFKGKDITELESFRIVTLGISQVPEGRRIFPDMTVYENLKIGSYNHKARPSREKNLETVFEHFPILKRRKNQLTRTLSGGEQQMVAVGSALMSDPSVSLPWWSMSCIRLSRKSGPRVLQSCLWNRMSGEPSRRLKGHTYWKQAALS